MSSTSGAVVVVLVVLGSVFLVCICHCCISVRMEQQTKRRLKIKSRIQQGILQGFSSKNIHTHRSELPSREALAIAFV